MVTKYFHVIHNSHLGTLGHIRDIKVHNFSDSRFPDTKSFQIICARRCRPMATNQPENAYYAFYCQPPNADQSDLTESFSDCQRIQNFARNILIKRSTDSLWMLLKRDVFKTFQTTKTFHVAMLQRYKGFWDSGCGLPGKNFQSTKW